MPCLKLSLRLGERESPELQFQGSGKHLPELTWDCCLVLLLQNLKSDMELGAPPHTSLYSRFTRMLEAMCCLG